MFESHTTSLPCPKCRYAVKAGELDELDFCSDCGHFHAEADCPVPVSEDGPSERQIEAAMNRLPEPVFTMSDKDDPGRAMR